MSINKSMSNKICIVLFLTVALVAFIFTAQVQAGGNKGNNEDIILYNGNIVLRGGGGKGKGKGNGGSIVVANSPQGMDIMPMYGGWEGFGRKRR